MKIITNILILLLFISCKTVRTESELSKTNTITEYFQNGNIKSVGNIDDYFKEYYKYRIGLWNEYYENGQLKESGNYKLDKYTQCCVGGVCDGFYSYKIGEWLYYHENGKLKVKGTYRIGKKHKKTSCESGDEINFGYITKSWKFYDKIGNEIIPTEKEINEIEKSSFLDELDMKK